MHWTIALDHSTIFLPTLSHLLYALLSKFYVKRLEPKSLRASALVGQLDDQKVKDRKKLMQCFTIGKPIVQNRSSQAK